MKSNLKSNLKHLFSLKKYGQYYLAILAVIVSSSQAVQAKPPISDDPTQIPLQITPMDEEVFFEHSELPISLTPRLLPGEYTVGDSNENHAPSFSRVDDFWQQWQQRWDNLEAHVKSFLWSGSLWLSKARESAVAKLAGKAISQAIYLPSFKTPKAGPIQDQTGVILLLNSGIDSNKIILTNHEE